MADDSIDWGDVGQAAAALVVAFAAQAGFNALLNGGKDKSQASTLFADKQPLPFATVLVGGPSRVAGATMFDESDGSWDILIRAIHDGRILPITQHYLNDDIVTKDGAGWVTGVSNGGVTVTDGRYVDQKVKFNVRLGLPVETADADVTGRFPSLWDSTCRGDGTATVTSILIAPKAKFVPQAFPAREPQSITDIAQPDDIYDWRDEAQDRADPTTWGPCENSVVNTVHVLWYRLGMDWDRCIAPVLADLTAEADIADLPRAKKGGGTEPLYRMAGSYTDDMDRKDILQKLKDSMDGFVTTDGLGRLVVKCGHYEEPDFIVTNDDIEGGLRWSRGIYRDDRVSEIQITFANPASDYNMVACDPWVIDEDGGKASPLALDWVTTLGQARYLGRCAAARANPAYTGRIPLSSEKGRAGLGKRWMRIQNTARASMADVVCEVRGTEINLMTGQVIFDVITITDPYTGYDAETMEGEPVDATARVTGELLTTPVINSVTPYFDGQNVRLRLVVTGPDAPLTWYFHWRKTGETAWSGTQQGDDVPIGGSVYFNTDVVTAASSIEVEVFYKTAGGAASPFSATETVNSAIIPPSWADPGALWQAELTSTSNRFWTGDTEYATLAAAITASNASFARSGSKWAASAAGAYSSFSSGVIAMTDQGAALEPAEINSIVAPDAFSNAAWIATNGSKTAGQTTPFGSDGALFTANGGNSQHYLTQGSLPSTNGQNSTVKLTLGPGTSDRVQVTLGGAFGSTLYANLYLSGAGSISAQSGVTAAIHKVGSDYEVSLTAPATSGGSSASVIIANLLTGSETRLPTITSAGTFYVKHAEYKVGSGAGTPINGASRNADALVVKPVPGTYDIDITYSDASVTSLTGVAITSTGYAVPTALGKYATKVVGS